jgi:hypothetical protein
MKDSVEIFADELVDCLGERVRIVALFNGVEYYLGRTALVNPPSTEVVELLRFLADEIEAITLVREADSEHDDQDRPPNLQERS